MTDLYTQALTTMESAGMKAVGRGRAARILAVCYLFGDEPFVFNKSLHDLTMHAARTYGFDGGKTPDEEVVAKIRNNVKALMDGQIPDWLLEIEEKYGLNLPRNEDGGLCVFKGVDRETRLRESEERRRRAGETPGACD